MTITGIIFLLLIGVILVLLEILVIPGVGVVGVIGALMMFLGVYFAYQIDVTYGHLLLGGSVMFSAISGFMAFRAETWDRFSLKKELKGKVNVIDNQLIKVGDKGLSVSRLAIAGQARFNENLFEVHSKYGMIENNVNIEVVKIESNKIIVIKLN
ncbi:MAG: NfeD family protein [Flavobacteriales bacterium]|nr:NfeD family protein [Flavobacteriales bacterium]